MKNSPGELWLPEFYHFQDVLQHGIDDKGYAKDGWLINPISPTMNIQENCDHMFHHLAKIYAGEWIDPDSRLPHFHHLACRAVMGYTRFSRKISHPKDTISPEIKD